MKKRDPRREVTYDVFAHELWTRINKKAKVDYHPTLVWTEIQSFIEVQRAGTRAPFVHDKK